MLFGLMGFTVSRIAMTIQVHQYFCFYIMTVNDKIMSKKLCLFDDKYFQIK